MSHNLHTKSALQSRIQNIWTRSITYHIKNKFSNVIYYKKTKTKPPLPPKKENKKRKTILDFDILPVPIFSSSITYCSNLVQLSLISIILSTSGFIPYVGVKKMLHDFSLNSTQTSSSVMNS